MAYVPPSWMRQFDGPGDQPSTFTYGVGEPDADWRPFSDASPWNTPLPSTPAVAADSSTVITWLNSLGGPVDRWIGVGGTVDDYDHPWYFAAEGDPRARVKILKGSKDPSVYLSGSTTPGKRRVSDLQNRVIPLPAVADQAPSDDGHMAIVTATHSYEMWQGNNYAPGEGRVGCASGAVYPLDGDGSSTDGHSATAGGVSLLAGQIRLAQLQNGHIPHALAIVVQRVRHQEYVAPATGVGSPEETATPGDAEDLKRPKTGSRLQLNYTEAEIDALSVPAWKKTILHAMREYGMIIMDTGGSSWGIQVESGTMDTAHGQPDRWRAFAASQGWGQSGGSSSPYVMPLKTGVDWTRLRIVEV